MKLSRLLLVLLLCPHGIRAEIQDAPPAQPDPAQRYLIYLHGGILAGTDGTAESPLFGPYNYDGILRAFADADFYVISEIRPNNDLDAHVQRTLAWIQQLRDGGVPPSQIAVVGASMGGVIAGRVSHVLREPEVRFVLIASLYDMASLPPVPLSGRVLSIHDESDERAWVDEAYLQPGPLLPASRVEIPDTGLGHGLLYTPHKAWLNPTLEWLH